MQEGSVVLSWTDPSSTDLTDIEITYTPGSSMVYTQAAGLNGATISGSWFFNFFLIGTDEGGGAITDSNGMVLDGDEDGEAGGHYELNLYIIG